ncbi:unnamed protein product [Candidula unifasciata]|uniref:Glycoprotein hormone subunit beta domain-containing protein n=1 Tax=Candidula unifasciata TaxID=100452 RepID=A0A8S3ZKQ2_9EUPU|nr:unnamed protein product [Candidula unifasciata]
MISFSSTAICCLEPRFASLPLLNQPAQVFTVLLIYLSLLLIPTASVNPNTTLGCHIRQFEQHVTKPPMYTREGAVVRCSGRVAVNSCWGRCDSSEIGDYQMPFRISSHPVCTYTARINRVVILTDCPGYPDPTEVVFDAAGCECRLCNSDYTSCENLTADASPCLPALSVLSYIQIQRLHLFC